METRASGPSSLLSSLRDFIDGVLGSVHDRIELLGVELQEEKIRVVQILLWVAAIVFFSILAVIFVSLVLVVVFWETARVAVVTSLAVGYVLALAGTIVGFRRFLTKQSKPFAGTLRELREDRACLRRES